MSEDIQKEPVSPLRAELPLAPPDHPAVDDSARPSFPWTMEVAGAVWGVAGSLLFLLVPLLLYEAWPRLLYFLHGVAYPLDLALLFVLSVLSIAAALSGATFLRAGIRIIRRMGSARPGRGLAVYSLVFALLLAVVSLDPALVALEFLLASSGPQGGGTIQWNWSVVVPYTMFAVVGVPASVLLLTAGILALAGRSRYELWWKAQNLSGQRGAPAENPFGK